MNNEELALSIQAGDAAQCGPLWEQVKGIVIARARGYAAAYGDLCAACGVTAEDLEQSGFLAMLDAAEDYDPGRGCKFNTLLSWKLKLQFRAALDGGRRRRARDPLNDCQSLDAPAPGREEAGETVGDLLPDPVPACEDAEERVFQEQLGGSCPGLSGRSEGPAPGRDSSPGVPGRSDPPGDCRPGGKERFPDSAAPQRRPPGAPAPAVPAAAPALRPGAPGGSGLEGDGAFLLPEHRFVVCGNGS